MAVDQAMRSEILELVRRESDATFAALQDRINGFVPGENALMLEGNVCAWRGMTVDAVDTVIDLLQSKDLEMHSTSTLVYMADGAYLDLPIAKRPPAGGYKERHWAPILLTLPKRTSKT
jgi:hypothetical protein